MSRLLLALILLGCSALPAAGQAHLLIVSGIGGEPRYVEAFHEWGMAMVDAAAQLGVPQENVVYLAEDPARDPRIDAESRREAVEAAIGDLAARAAPSDRVLILLVGHGSSDARGARINLPGPDFTAEELAGWLEAFPTQPLIVVNTASASGDFQEPLAAPGRTVVTATRSGMERNETRFGRYFVEAFIDGNADADRDGRVTIAEAFEYATRETERAYTSNNELQMERARMEGDLALAQSFHLGSAVTAAVPTDAGPEVRALHETRQRLEREIDELRNRAGQMEAEAYSSELERLLLELARVNRSIEEAGR